MKTKTELKLAPRLNKLLQGHLLAVVTGYIGRCVDAASKAASYRPVIAVMGAAFLGRCLTMPPFLESFDATFFVKGVERYSLAEMRPYWPGYPVYIWVGQFFNLFAASSLTALHLVSITATTLSILPLASLTKQLTLANGGDLHQAQRASLLAALLWAVVPNSWLSGSEIFAHPLANFLSLTMLWLCYKALTNPKYSMRWLVLAASVAGIMLGVRLSCVAFLPALIYSLLVSCWRGFPQAKLAAFRRMFVVILAFLLTIGIWLGWQVLQDGNYVLLASNNININVTMVVQRVGGKPATSNTAATATSSADSVAAKLPNSSWSQERPAFTQVLGLLENWLVEGLGGWSPNLGLERLPLTICLLGLLASGTKRIVQSAVKANWLLIIIWGSFYALWVLLSHNITLPRYFLPLVALSCSVAGLGLMRNRRLAYAVLIIVGLNATIITIPLALENKANPPIGTQLANYANSHFVALKDVLIINNQTAYLYHYLQSEAPNFPVSLMPENAPNNQFITELTAQFSNLYIIGQPNISLADWSPVVRLCRNNLIESVGFSEIEIYRYTPGQTTTPQLPCHKL